jgi:replicative DNA helicase
MTFTKDVHYSTPLEQAILGQCLIEMEAFGRVYHKLNPDNFYQDGHKMVFETLKSMYENGQPIDCFTVIDQLTRVKGHKQIHRVNTDHFVLKLTNHVVNTAHLEYHAFVVQTMWMEREIIKLTHGPKLEGDTRTKIRNLQDQLQALQMSQQVNEWCDMTELMVKMYQHQEEMKKSEGVGISCGVRDLDEQNGGFHNGQMIVVGARPSVGKSAFIGGIAIHMAKTGKKVGIVSLEMSNEEIAARLAALDTDTDFNVLFRGLYADEYQTNEVYRHIGSYTSQLPIFVSDKTNVNMLDIKAKAQRLKALHGCDCIMIDYLQLINTEELKGRTRENEISKISRQCKIMAKEMNIPVILLCQLNREVTKREYKNRLPKLSDLRESGSIEQDADVVMFLHRDDMAGFNEDEQGNSTAGQADLVIRKWRNGMANFTIPLDFNGRLMKFTRRSNGWHPVTNVKDVGDDQPF